MNQLMVDAACETAFLVNIEHLISVEVTSDGQWVPLCIVHYEGGLDNRI
jgi:hypothetical protein